MGNHFMPSSTQNLSEEKITQKPVRKTLYDLACAEKNVPNEIQNLAGVFEKAKCIREDYDDYSLEEYISKYLFLDWRNRCLANFTQFTLYDMKRDHDIFSLSTYFPTDIQCYAYLEYLVNMMKLFEYGEHNSQKSIIYRANKPLITGLNKNIDILLSQLNLVPVEKVSELYILIDKDPSVTEAAEILQDNQLISPLLEYNHVAIRDDVNEKRRILQLLASDAENKADYLEKKTGFADLGKDLNTLLNNLHLRHNNLVGNHAKPVTQKMSDDERLHWYDVTYRCYLHAILAYEYNILLKKEIKYLKDQFGQKKSGEATSSN
jgi:hypothetical protein